ncbi:MAG TPA: sensor histidine kinase [Streptosporangiaceae bacterium]|nr:sensor histidine kinase [Streptosporangiaceae bacterium]
MNRAGTRPPAFSAHGQGPGAGLRHEALLCQGQADCVASVLPFIHEWLARAQAVLVGVSAGLARQLRQQVDEQSAVSFFDMTELGRNPGRIIPAMLDFAGTNPGRALRYVSQPFWAGRPAAENVEAGRHEALIELALAGCRATVLCVYDLATLDQAALGCAEQTHPVIISGGRTRSSRGYAGTGVVPPQCDRPLAPPPRSATRLAYSADLRQLRTLVTDCAASAGLAPGRTADMVLAASEVAANTLRHARADGMLQVWHTRREIICQITDPGVIRDPLAGRRRPGPAASGQGLWVVNQVCDLVELRSGPDGTIVRMHIRLPGLTLTGPGRSRP